jgi:hypothetical protein
MLITSNWVESGLIFQLGQVVGTGQVSARRIGFEKSDPRSIKGHIKFIATMSTAHGAQQQQQQQQQHLQCKRRWEEAK